MDLEVSLPVRLKCPIKTGDLPTMEATCTVDIFHYRISVHLALELITEHHSLIAEETMTLSVQSLHLEPHSPRSFVDPPLTKDPENLCCRSRDCQEVGPRQYFTHMKSLTRSVRLGVV